MLRKAQAEKLTERIGLKLETMITAKEGIEPLIAEAWHGEAHKALGYDSWEAYVQDRFGDRLAVLNRPPARFELESYLINDLEMSESAAAATAGVSRTVIRQDQDRGHVVQKNKVAGRKTKGLDGKTYGPRPTPEEMKNRDDQVAKLWQEGFTRDDICAAMGVSHGVVSQALRIAGLPTKRPIAGLQPKGRLEPASISWRGDHSNVIKLPVRKTHCDLNEELADKKLNEIMIIIEDFEIYEDLTHEQADRMLDLGQRLVRYAKQYQEDQKKG